MQLVRVEKQMLHVYNRIATRTIYCILTMHLNIGYRNVTSNGTPGTGDQDSLSVSVPDAPASLQRTDIARADRPRSDACDQAFRKGPLIGHWNRCGEAAVP